MHQGMDPVNFNLTKRLARYAGGAVAGVFLAFSATTAHASLIGDSVSLEHFTGSTGHGAMTATVGTGSEFSLFGLVFDLDGSSIHISNSTSGTVRFPFSSHESFVFDSLDWLVGGMVDPTAFITNLIVTPTFIDYDADAPPSASGDANTLFAANNVSFMDHMITVDMAGYVFDPDTTLDIQIITNKTPEPATLVLLGFGLASLGVMARRRSR